MKMKCNLIREMLTREVKFPRVRNELRRTRLVARAPNLKSHTVHTRIREQGTPVSLEFQKTIRRRIAEVQKKLT